MTTHWPKLWEIGEMARTTTNVVNLDALIERADLAATGEGGEDINAIYVTGLEPKGWLYQSLRKPDFQRETSDWQPDAVAGIIQTFLSRELIPAIILWRSGSDVFVIDGAHRLSALIAWVHDDYGDGEVSRRFFHNLIPEDQIKAANKTRELVNSTVGSYRTHRDAIDNPDRADPSVRERAQRMGWQNIEVQWIRTQDAERAEKSFFRINQGGERINETEQRILKARRSAPALTSRAILRGGTGHNYWHRFDSGTQARIEDIGRQIHDLMFKPAIELPVKTLDLPMAGQGYGPHVLPFVFDLVGLCNRLAVPSSGKKNDELPDDTDGMLTLAYLTEVRRILWRLCSNNPSSLGLHPVLYFYSRAGTFQPAALLSIVNLMRDWDTPDYRAFTSVREGFEEILLANRSITEAIRKLGSANRSRPRIVGFYRAILNRLLEGKTPAEVAAALQATEEYGFLIEPQDEEPMFNLEGGSFTREVKGAAFIASALPTVSKCPTCRGLIHRNGIQTGHVKAKRDGGSGRVANAIPQHPFCNSTFAN
jgi:hypothetical protein